ncbi:MAG TPA: class I SAM-dependent methyltransferase [Natronosporangium sp.]|nr:class I SAM-dependent methyltransferase [Natronosporangium sp.]
MTDVTGSRIVYDDQADVFEARAGVPEEAAAQVAAAVHDLRPAAPDGLLVEVGAGTGVIGRWLARLPGRYLGLDSSAAMLRVFRPRLAATPGAALLVADADTAWPVRDGAAAVIFGSRVLHLLRPDHAVAQVRRIAHRGGALLLCGRIVHSPDSPRTRARQRLRELLAEQGLRPRPTGGRPDRLLALAVDQGAEPLPVRVAAAWPETVTTGQVIDWWRGKTSLGGVNPSREVADAVLAALAGWARDTQPAGPVTTTTRYLLEGVRLPAVAPGAARPRGAPTRKE